ncbi:hypothetical protein HUJ04_007740 [Dendroctonus ponderosae]|nr:hypothetical protein HUJ04_007740 [Dendroctonus ponderosae]
MNAPKTLPRIDPYEKPPAATNGISPKIYTQQPKASKQQQNELKKKSDYNSLEDIQIAATTAIKGEDRRIPRRLIMDPSGKPRSKNVTSTVNSKFEELSKRADDLEQKPTNQRELNLDNKSTNSDLQANIDADVERISRYMDSIIDIEDEENNGYEKNRAKQCLDISRRAFNSGRTRKLAFREKQLKGLLKFLENHRTEIEDAVYKDLRKHRQETNISEIELVANDLRHTLLKLKTWVGPERPQKRIINFLDNAYIYNDPYGVVLIIGAWNYPILLTLGPLVGKLQNISLL